jgi:Zn ribbon nucleic-acid-binding protein
MADMKCKYCGKKFMAGFTCPQSPAKKHLLDEK